jgi:hypothetical protein
VVNDGRGGKWVVEFALKEIQDIIFYGQDDKKKTTDRSSVNVGEEN